MQTLRDALWDGVRVRKIAIQPTETAYLAVDYDPGSFTLIQVIPFYG